MELELTPNTKHQLTSMLDWLKSKPEDERYTVERGCSCLFAQYFHEVLGEKGYIDIRTINHTFNFNAFDTIAAPPSVSEEDYTFSQAIDRIERILVGKTPIEIGGV